MPVGRKTRVMAAHNHRLVLASASPRRKDLLAQAGYKFEVCASDADEQAGTDVSPDALATLNASRKAHAVQDTLADTHAVVIGADTIVVLNGTVFGKPAYESEAKRMLEALSGHTHEVITGVCILSATREDAFAETTRVSFRELSNCEIDAYVKTGEPLDKAGAYGIQGFGGKLVSQVQGDYNNVVGLPVARLSQHLAQLGIEGSAG